MTNVSVPCVVTGVWMAVLMVFLLWLDRLAGQLFNLSMDD